MLPAPFYERDGQIAIDLPGALAVFTTRSWGDVRSERSQVERRLGVPTRFSKQIHGNRAARADRGAVTANGDLGLEADALVTATAGLAASVLTADCLPIAIAAPAAVAAVHAGWRGLADGVIANAVRLLRTLGSDEPLTAAIGPAAGACCYEVGPELHARFPGYHRGENLDLKAIAGDQLRLAGVTVVHDCGICTICETDYELFSYRREGEQTGRQGLIAWLS